MFKFVPSTLLILLLVVSAGCYTQLRMPPAEPYLSSPAVSSADVWDNWYAPPGFDLYDPWTLPYYTSFYGPAPGRWVPYSYYYPWWHGQDPWTPPPSNNSPPVETGGRHAWDRGPGSPSLPGISGGGSPGGSGGGSIGKTPTPPSDPPAPPPAATPAPDTSGTRERPKPAEKEPRRNAWGR